VSEIQQNRYDQLLRRVADLKGPGSMVNDALGELFPVLEVENLPAELLVLAGTRLCNGRTFRSAPGVGFFTAHHLANPVDSGFVATILLVSVITDTLQTVRMTTGNDATLGAVGSSDFLDTRLFGQGTVMKTRSQGALATAVTPAFTIEAVDNAFVFSPPKGVAVITPGFVFSIGPGTEDTEMQVSWMWIEREAQPSELNL